MDVDEQNEDWRLLCENSLLKNHLPIFEKIFKNEFKSDDSEFLNSYLKPFVVLLDSIRIAIEFHCSQIDNDQFDAAWLERYENLVGNIIHPSVLKIGLHKGDFYLHLSSTPPRKLQLKFYDSGTTQSRTLSTDDCVYLCSEDWADNLRKEAKNRFVYSNCIFLTSRGLERKPWRTIFSPDSSPKDLQSQLSRQSMKRGDSISFDLEERGKRLAELEEKPLHILELEFEIVHSQIAYLPGTRDKRGGAVIVIRSYGGCWDNLDVSSTELAKLFMYYYKIPRLDVQKLGCSLVIDARQGKHVPYVLQCIGEAITLFQEKVPDVVHMAYVITKKDSLLLLMAAGKIRDKLNFEFQLLSNLNKMYEDISQDQLPTEFGGSLVYDHEKWIKFRTHLEPFMISCRSAAKHAMASIKELADVKLGDTASECRELLDQHQKVIKSVLEDCRLTNLREEGKKILDRLAQPSNDVLRTMDYDDTVNCVHNLYAQMDHLFAKFQNFSSKKSKKLEMQLNMCSFDEESEKLLHWIETEGMPFLTQHTDIGDSMGHAASLQADFLHFKTSAEEPMNEIKKALSIGQDLVDLNSNEVPWVKERLENLECENDKFVKKMGGRAKSITQVIEYYSLFEQASDWSLQCLRYIAQMNMEELQTLEGIQNMKEDLDSFLNANVQPEEKDMARMTKLAHHLESEKLKMQAGQISGRCSEVDEMIKKKLHTIKKAEERFLTVQSSASSETSSGIEKDADLATECGDDSKEQDENIVGPMFSWRNDAEKNYDENDELLVAFDAQISPKHKERLQYIAKELSSTEKDYVASLEYILKNYIPEMERASLPPTLAGKKNILFGNIERIYDFHKRYFSQELEIYLHAPLQVGKCFIRWERQFYLYALYNKNKPKSDQLLEDFGNAYFTEKQNELKDKLNLASFLIKPVQRLGKYALLLKDIANCISAEDPRFAELLTAQDMIKFQLRHGNDLLAMDSVRDCDVNLRAQGCLLRQADFVVYNNKKKHLRRVFLFEDLILFSKAKKQEVQGDCFVYKDSLKISDVGLTENIGEKGLRFEVWYRRWRKSKKSQSYILQASSIDVKRPWVMDIRKLLLTALQRSIDYSRSEMTTGISVESPPSGLYLESSSPSFQSQTQALRSRAESHPRKDSQATRQYKRQSIVSSESGATNCIHDANASSENDRMVIKSAENSIKASNSFTLPRKYNPAKDKDEQRIKCSNTADALIDMPFRQARLENGEPEASFVRNTIKRRTLHVDFAAEQFVESSTASGYLKNTDQKHASPTLDEVGEDSDGSSGYKEPNTAVATRRMHSVSVTNLPLSPASPVSSMQASTPCIATSPEATTLPASNSLNFTFTNKKKDEKSKEKGKDKQKKGKDKQKEGKDKQKEGKDKQKEGKDKQKEGKDKQKEGKDKQKEGRRISLGGFIGRKKKSSSTSSDINIDKTR